jgi:hypothetical protein
MRKLLVVLAVVFAPASTTVIADEERPAYADVMHPQPIAELFAAAVKHGGFTKQCAAEPDFCQMPMVLVRPLEEGTDGSFFYREPNFIQVNHELTPGTLRFNETVVHEFVHYLQWTFGEYGATTRCWDLGDIEAKAYLAGAAYLKDVAGVVVDYKEQIAWQRLGSVMCRYGAY